MVALSRFALVTAKFVIIMLPACPCCSTSALASRFWISARLNSPTSTSAWMISASAAASESVSTLPDWMLPAVRDSMCPNAAYSSSASIVPAVSALMCATRASMLPACRSPICAQSMLALSILAVVIWAFEISAMPA